MATNPLFNNFEYGEEQNILEDMVVEAIQLAGQDMLYIPRRRTNFDKLYYEDDSSLFDTSYPIEIFVKNADGFGSAQMNFMGKFSLEIRDQVTFTVARRTFDLLVHRHESDITRPREGDLIYFPLNKKCFVITFVDDKPFFYQLGQLQMYDLTCELFEYSMETMSTGIDAVDILQKNHSVDVFDYTITTFGGVRIKTANGDYLVSQKLEENIQEFDALQDNTNITEAVFGDDVIDFSEANPFAESQRY